MEPTKHTRFYVPCPYCQLCVRGSMSGSELENHQVSIECRVVDGARAEGESAAVVTINPFAPSLYGADSFSEEGAFPTMTLMVILGDDALMEFESERHRALESTRSIWPKVRMLFEYYLNSTGDMVSRLAKQHFDFDSPITLAHQRTSLAYQILGLATSVVVGKTGAHREKFMSRFGKKHRAAISRSHEYLQILGQRATALPSLERDLFTEINRYVENYESWEMGLLIRFLTRTQLDDLDRYVLYRDEFSILRDLYQQGFELACKCLWILVAAQNTIKRSDPNDFGFDHPSIVPLKQRSGNLNQFDKLPNAYKIAYVAQVPGWESLGALLDSQRRNTIGHATARHDLHAGRIVSDKDPVGMAYLEFLGELLGVFEALTTLAQVLRAAQVASSPDFRSTPALK
jgi:hypothetical protein